ncbi:MAG TPA: ATP-binding protein [Thermoleophilaceae bacterium]|nr:ATP-binding protein [Thermoleophilaceae bacterium]
MAQRLPLQSAEPVVWFARLRLLLACAALLSALVFDIPHKWRAVAVIGAVAITWSAGLLVLAGRRRELAMSPLVACGDVLLLGIIQVAEPAAYAPLRFIAIFFVATHAYFLGELRGLVVSIVAILALVPAALFLDVPLEGGMLAYSEVLFALSAICCGLFVARLRTTESAARLRARDLSRRSIEAEAQVRRRIANSIHDGPVQELIGLDLLLASVDQALARGDDEHVRERLAEARSLTERNIGALRDEIVGLGPYAFDELTFAMAIEQCAPVWQRRYRVDIEMAVEPLDLNNETCGALFGIAQEAVANAGQHAGATRVVVTLRTVGDEVELRCSDDGHGFEDVDPSSTTDPGHIGLATMRERAALIGGRLAIETGDRGTKVLVRAPLRAGDSA